MITANLKGGLGNQLFQYAAGRALALRKNTELALDISGYIKGNGIDTPRQYELAIFNIQANIPSIEEMRKLRNPYGPLTKALRLFKMKVLRKFNLKFRSISGVYLDGFFQSEKYFAGCADVIRNDLTLKNPLGTMAQEVSIKIKSSPNSVSLHVRRGDYVSDANTNKYHGTCGPEYYSKALEYITSKIGKDISVFIFSDDIEWVKKNMQINFPVSYVSHPEIKDYEELVLMSQCEHNIIANSSFSWWGAWLNGNGDKIVVAPRMWTRRNQSLYKDIIPSLWIRI